MSAKRIVGSIYGVLKNRAAAIMCIRVKDSYSAFMNAFPLANIPV